MKVLLIFWGYVSLAGSLPASEPPSWDEQWKSLEQVEALLRTVPEGRRLLAQAKAKDLNYRAKIKAGQSSFTESVFTRTFSLATGGEKISLKHEITLSKNLNLADAVVDLAHEMVHFSEKQVLDPYRPGFEKQEFIRRGIEGPGGELEALARECALAWELESAYKTFPKHRLCAPYKGAGAQFNRNKALQDYYLVGGWFHEIPQDLRVHLPLLRKGGVVFTSSYARKPYPMALAEEYDATLQAACVNNQRKYHLIAATQMDRAPASIQLQQEKRRLKVYQKIYCQGAGKHGER